MSDERSTENRANMGALVQPILLFFATALAAWVVNTTHQQDLAIMRLEVAVAQLTRTSWTRTDQRVWIKDVKAVNPTLALPDLMETFRPTEDR